MTADKTIDEAVRYLASEGWIAESLAVADLKTRAEQAERALGEIADGNNPKVDLSSKAAMHHSMWNWSQETARTALERKP